STDNITVVSQSGNMLQIIYPTSNGYKMGWIETSGSNNNSNSNSNNSNNFAIIYEGWYRIGAKLSPGKGLDVDNAKMGDRVNVQLWTYVNVPQQKFYIKHIGNGWHTIRAGHSGKALDVNISAGYNVEQYSYDAGDAQLWRFVKNGDGTYCIHSKLGKALDCYNAGTDDGNNICVWDFHGGDAQRWILSKVSQSSSSNSTSSSSSSYTNKLKSLINQYNEKKWTGSYYGAVQCKGFASMIFNQLFGTGYIGSGSVSSNKTNYILNNLNGNVRKVGTLYNYSVNQLADLMSQARPGDFLQVRRTNGGPHSMIVVSVNSDSVNIFDCNSRGDLVVHYYTQSFSTFRSKNIGVSLYTAKSY
ncbi:MAG: RICIN domain-containing protein, partial [bacterium]